jgi:REP-associated tyrosine transposase
MTAFRRLYIPGGTYFFTVSLADRNATTLIDEIELLRSVYASVVAQHPVKCHAMVVMPNHIHAVWTLPDGDSDFSIRWRKIKGVFSRHCVASTQPNQSLARKGEKGIWQRRFWEHAIRCTADFQAHVDHCHFNPVKHGLAKSPADWPYSSIHRNQAKSPVFA